jgi:hypothetical protein
MALVTLGVSDVMETGGMPTVTTGASAYVSYVRVDPLLLAHTSTTYRPATALVIVHTAVVLQGNTSVQPPTSRFVMQNRYWMGATPPADVAVHVTEVPG